MDAGLLFTKTTLGDVVHYVTGDPPPQGNMLDGPCSEDTGNGSCTVFGDQCELRTKWDGSPLPGCQEAWSEVKVDAGVRAAIVGNFHLHPGSHFVPPLPCILRLEVLGYPHSPPFFFSHDFVSKSPGHSVSKMFCPISQKCPGFSYTLGPWVRHLPVS